MNLCGFFPAPTTTETICDGDTMYLSHWILRICQESSLVLESEEQSRVIWGDGLDGLVYKRRAERLATWSIQRNDRAKGSRQGRLISDTRAPWKSRKWSARSRSPCSHWTMCPCCADRCGLQWDSTKTFWDSVSSNAPLPSISMELG